MQPSVPIPHSHPYSPGISSAALPSQGRNKFPGCPFCICVHPCVLRPLEDPLLAHRCPADSSSKTNGDLQVSEDTPFATKQNQNTAGVFSHLLYVRSHAAPGTSPAVASTKARSNIGLL